MKNKEGAQFKLPVWGICVVLLLLVIWEVIEERMGTFPNYRSGRHSHNELLGIFMPLMVLVYPVFQRKYKEKFWNWKSLVLLFSTLIISTVLIVIMYANKEYYRIDWIEGGHWDWDHCPPIIWDVWNIIGK